MSVPGRLAQQQQRQEEEGHCDDYLLVAAIDFGTAFSGYAFSPRVDFNKDPLKVMCKL